MIDLTTEYLGLKLKSPILVSSSPLTDSPENIQRLEQAGAAAVVLPSIFEEQLTLESNALDSDLSRGTESFAESLSYFPAYESYRQGHDAYLSHILRAKAVAGIPVLASLNGATAGGWVKFAKEIEQAGADALELNTYSLPTDPRVTSAAIEDGIVDLVRQVKQSTTIPIAVKLSPQFTSIPHLAARLDKAGRRCARPLQPLLPAGLRHRKPQRHSHAHPQPPGGAAAASALDCNPLRRSQRGHRRHRRRAQRPGCTQGHHGRRTGCHARLGAAGQRHPAISQPSSPICCAGWRSTSTSPSARCAAASAAVPCRTPLPSNAATTSRP